MRCTAGAGALSAAVHLASRAVSPRTTLPALSNVLLEAADEGLRVSGTNLDLTISVVVGAQEVEEGRATAPARLLSELLASLPEAPCTLSVRESSHAVELHCDVHRSRLQGMDPVEYPPLPGREGAATLLVDGEEFERAVGQVVIAASADEASPVLTGVLLQMGEEQLTMVATDRHRLTRRTVAARGGGGEVDGGADIIVPARHLIEVARAVDASGPGVELWTGGGSQVFFRVGAVDVTSRLVEGRYPNYQQVIPADSSTVVRVATTVLRRTVRTAAVLARDIGNPIRLRVAERSVVLEAQTAEVGEDEATLAATVEGEGMRIAFNARYLLDVLNAIDAEEVEIGLNGPLLPAVVRPVDAEEYLCVIMPVRVP